MLIAVLPTKPLREDEHVRYARHHSLPLVGVEGQRHLKRARVLIVGAGGLGSPLALYLAAAGIGRIGLVDFDRVDASNLQRQVLYDTADIGRPKSEAAAARLRALNPHVEVVEHAVAFSPANAIDLVRAYDIVADGSDNFATRYLLNDACVLAGIPYVYGSVLRFEGQVSVFAVPGGPNVRDLYPEPPVDALTCGEAGVLGVLPGLIGSLQATEVLKWILGIGDLLAGRVLLVDALTMQFRSFTLDPDPDNPVSGRSPLIRTVGDSVAFTQAQGCALSISSPSAPMSQVPEITVEEYNAMREGDSPPFLLDVRRLDEVDIAEIGGTLIPLDQLPSRLDELEDHRDDPVIVVHCRSGGRSAQATAFLHQHGYTNAVNLAGGILAWSDRIDPSVQKY
ncbi:MAG: molybdopterin-synthase adenylyltransferase MoeB [Bacteroidota bacterium]